MLVVSDASPINILVRSGFVELLPALFREVLIPPAVEREMTHVRTPVELREWMNKRPAEALTRARVKGLWASDDIIDAALARDAELRSERERQTNIERGEKGRDHDTER